MIELDLGSGTRLRPLRAADAPELHARIEQDREHLDRWLRWSPELRSAADAAAFLAGFESKAAAGEGFHLGIFEDGALAGGVICWAIHPRDRTAELGYWLGTAHLGKGLATRALGAVSDHLFGVMDVHRIELWCAEGNVRSRAVPERLGFRLESVRRGSHRTSGGFLNHVIYARLAGEPREVHPARPLLTDSEFRAKLDRLGDAWTRRDYAAAASEFGEDVRYADPMRYAIVGRAALRAFFENDEGREQRVSWHNVMFDAPRQVGSAEYTYEGSHQYHGAVLVQLAGGLVARWREYQHVDGRSWEEFAGETRFP